MFVFFVTFKHMLLLKVTFVRMVVCYHLKHLFQRLLSPILYCCISWSRLYRLFQR